MATVIHHGGGVGTYKTFAVIQRHAIPQIKNGRLIISTIRGFDNVRVCEAVLGFEAPPESKIIFVDLETTEGIERIRRWWEWVPKGAFIIIDEAQLIYPKTKRLNYYDYKARDGLTGEEAAQQDDKPNGLLQALTMQRHWNWDLAIITPNIKMLIPEIREVTQIAYEHRYLGGLLPWRKHGWREVQHLPAETSKGSVHEPKSYNADKRIYNVYKSTKTGAHTDSKSEQSIFKNPKIVSSVLCAFFGIIAFIYILSTQIFGEGGTLSLDKNNQKIIQVSNSANTDNVPSRVSGSLTSVQRTDIKSERVIQQETTTFESQKMAIVGKLFDEYVIEVGTPPNTSQFTTGYLHRNGIDFEIINDCRINMTYANVNYAVRCPLHRRNHEQQQPQKSGVIISTPFSGLTSTDEDASKRAMASGASSG